MKTIHINLYKFEELNPEAQEKSIKGNWALNVENISWWDTTYEDAKMIGLEITGFDLDRGRYVNAEFIEDAYDTANKIKTNHGDLCDTYKIAIEFIKNWDNLVYKNSNGISINIVSEENVDNFDQEANELEEKFLKDICENYRKILNDEYEYLTSSEAIKETLIANEYDFIEDGKIY